jgi:O-antigen ligase
MLRKFDLELIYQYLLIALAFLMPLTVFGGNLIIVLICFIWLLSGRYKEKLRQILKSKFLIYSIIFYLLHVVGMLWTEDLEWGLHMLHKMWYFILLLPILFTIVDKDYINKYIQAFLLAISITEVASYLVWFEVVKPFKNASVIDPTPFMSHVSYNPILAFAIYLVYHQIFLNKSIDKIKLFIFSFFAITMTVNMFITGGRAGHIMYFVMVSILIYQFFNANKIKSIIAVMIIIPSIFFTAYQSSYYFKDRVDAAVINTLNYNQNPDTSVGLRITYAVNSFEIIKENPFFGVGTGDFRLEYKEINQKNTPYLPNTTNPHNMYTLVLTEFGLIGLISLLLIFYQQFKFSYSAPKGLYRDIGISMPILYLVIMLSDSYLLGHYTSLVFIFFSSFLYNNFEKD